MMDDDTFETRRFSQFSNAARPLTPPAPQQTQAQGLSSKLLQELHAAQEANQDIAYEAHPEAQAQTWTPSPQSGPDAALELQAMTAKLQTQRPAPAASPKQPSRARPQQARPGKKTVRSRKDKAPARAGALAKVGKALRLARLQKSYLSGLTHLHRRAFDTRVENLLFIKTPPLMTAAAWSEVASTLGQPAPFSYQGPIPRLVLNWIFSALPQDLKRYAFVDFHAGHGRTLLLAARHNFEYALGYCFDANACEQLEMNFAQYPRPYMSCRDLRAVRADRDGVMIPEQPVILFFPDQVRNTDLDIVLSHVSASYHLNPRPIHLIFENKRPDFKLEHRDIFRKRALPLLNRMKAALLSPGQIALYSSREGFQR